MVELDDDIRRVGMSEFLVSLFVIVVAVMVVLWAPSGDRQAAVRTARHPLFVLASSGDVIGHRRTCVVIRGVKSP